MIIRMRKYLFLGAHADLDHFFDRAQEKGIVEFISPSGKKPTEMPDEVSKLLFAIKILRSLPSLAPYSASFDMHFALELAERILHLQADIERFSEEKRFLEAESMRIMAFGDFSRDDIDALQKAGLLVQFFCCKTAQVAPKSLIYIATEYDLDYYISLSKESVSYPDMIEMRIDRPLGELKAHLQFVNETLFQCEAELKGFSGHSDYLHEALTGQMNRFHLHAAKKEVNLPMGESLFAVEAWVPAHITGALYSLMQGLAVHGEEVKVLQEDKVPTYMENRGSPRLGEDLIKIYDVPASTDKDPSGWVLWAFTLFFAMIVADGGYGLIFLAFAGYLKYKFPTLRGSSKRLLKLLTTLAVSCILWGALTSSFFGIHLDPEGLLSKTSLMRYFVEKKASYIGVQVDAEVFQSLRDHILLEFSLLVGTVHISLSLLRYAFRHPASLGWIAFLFGGYLYFPVLLHATSFVHFMHLLSPEVASKVGMQLLIGGAGSALLLALIQHRWRGLAEISQAVQVFADVLSYLRLYALGLAGTILAETFNGFGELYGFVIGAAIVLIGHSMNLVLGIAGGLIHGLRLNFIEWYHYSFEGGGRLFSPLQKLK